MQSSPLESAFPNYEAPTLQGFDTNDVAIGQRIGGAKNRQYVRFYNAKVMEPYTIEARINPATGSSTPVKIGVREVIREMVHIVTPGDTNEFNDRAEDYHRREYWPQYKAFREGRTAPIGTDIDSVEWISPNIATELRYFGVHTVEQLADASDLLCGKVPNGWELREFARSVCKANLENKSLNQVTALKDQLDSTNKQLAHAMEVISQMQAQMSVSLVDARGEPLRAQEAPRRGRPKKVTDQTVTE